jgi:hypothetical protein
MSPTPGAGESPVPSTSPGRPDGVPVVDLTMPDESRLPVRVLNATGVARVGPQIAAELAERGFAVVGVENADPSDHPEVPGLVYGPRAVGNAWVAQAYFVPPVRLEFDPEQDDDTVDIILGRAFPHLLTPTEVNQAVARNGQPTAPPGTCGVESIED